MVMEKELDSKCLRIANFLELNQEQAVWWSQTYLAWLENDGQPSPARTQVPNVDKTTDMNNFEEINQDSDNSVEISVDIPGQE